MASAPRSVAGSAVPAAGQLESSLAPLRQLHSAAEEASTSIAAVRRQALFRDLNEQIRRIAESFALDGPLQLVCECGQEDCLARLSVAFQDYEAVRRFPTRFITRAEHVCDDERVVQELAGSVVIEKIGDGAQTAILLDPRKPRTDGRAS
jgi:hypothetical protein